MAGTSQAGVRTFCVALQLLTPALEGAFEVFSAILHLGAPSYSPLM